MAASPKTKGCRVCGDPTRGGGRGLCQKHYRRWKAKFDAIALESGEEAAARFEAECLQQGWIKPRSAGGRPKEDDDPFDEIFAAIEQTQVSSKPVNSVVDKGSTTSKSEIDVQTDEADQLHPSKAVTKSKAKEVSTQSRKRKAN